MLCISFWHRRWWSLRSSAKSVIQTGTLFTLNPDLSSSSVREHLYFATGYGLIQCFKGLMSFEDEVRPCISSKPSADHMACRTCSPP